MTNEVVANENLEKGLIIPANDTSNLDMINEADRVMYTSLTDKKMIFNLGTKVDYKLNDCENKELLVKDVLIKTFRHENTEFNENTGLVDNDITFSKVCILIDDKGKSYVTGSKMFTNQMIDYIRFFGIDDIKAGLKVKIVKNKMSNSDNKYLAFELL